MSESDRSSTILRRDSGTLRLLYAIDAGEKAFVKLTAQLHVSLNLSQTRKAPTCSSLPMRTFTAIVLGLGLILKTTTAIANPVIEPDYSCYLQDANGTVMNLSDICGIAVSPPNMLLQINRTTEDNSTEINIPQSRSTGAPSGLSAGVELVRRLGSGRWSGHTIGRGPYDFERYPVSITGNGRSSSASTSSGITSNGRGRTASTGSGDGPCNSPNDVDSRGRRCGDRASSVRPGGRN